MLYRILNYSRKIRQVKLVLFTSLIFFCFTVCLLCMVLVKLNYFECYAVFRSLKLYIWYSLVNDK